MLKLLKLERRTERVLSVTSRKSCLAKSSGIAVYRQRLLLEVRVLKDNELLQSLEVPWPAVRFLVVRFGPFTVAVTRSPRKGTFQHMQHHTAFNRFFKTRWVGADVLL